MNRHPHHDAVVEALWRADAPVGAKVYAIVDGARDEAIHTFVRGAGRQWCCLYTGELPPEMIETAPFLVQLERGSAFTAELIARGWDEHWGIFMESVADLETLRRHFKRLLIVKDEEGTELLFRFYDPRVLRVYLPTCTDEERGAMFGPVGRFVIRAHEDARAAIHCSLDCPPRFSHGHTACLIRRGQIERLDQEIERLFRRSLALEVASMPEAATIDREALDVRIEAELVHARAHGLESTETLSIFVRCVFKFGAAFDSHPYVRHLLDASNGPPDMRFYVGMRDMEIAEDDVE